MQHGDPRALTFGGALQLVHCIIPPCLPQGDQAQVERCDAVVGPEFAHPAEFALGFDQHAGAIEGDAEIAMLVNARQILACRRRRRRRHAAQAAGGQQAEQHTTDLEFAQAGAIDDLPHRVDAVDQR